MILEEKYTDVISMIVSVYNVENYLERCINSIIAQTYKNIQIILVNDGSCDSCGEICRKFSQKVRIPENAFCT